MPGERSASTNPQAVPSSRDSGGSSPSQSVRAGSIARLGSPIPSLPSGTPAVRQIPTPSQTANSSSIQTPLPGRADPQSSLPGPSESNLSSALKESLGNSPPRFGPPPIRPLSPAQEAPPRVPPSDYGSFDGRGRSPVPYEDAEIVRRHLVGHQADQIADT